MFIVTFKRSLILSAVLLVAALAGTAGTSSAAIKTGVYDLFTFSNATQRADALQKTRDAGSNLAKSLICWRNVAPASEPANPTNPNVRLQLGRPGRLRQRRRLTAISSRS